MTIFKISSRVSMIAIGLSLAACAPDAADQAIAQEAPAKTKSVQLAPAITTVKPGASVMLNADVTEGLTAGNTGTANITFNEGYPSGKLTVTASAKDGLSVLGGEASTSFNMTDATTHTWRVDFVAETDGVHYLNVIAEAEPLRGPTQSRAHAIRVEVGDWKSVQAEREAAKPMVMQSDGEMAIMMQAEETIE